MSGAGVEAVLFDKDGTLFEFGATWNVWGLQVIRQLSGGDLRLLTAMADAARYDLGQESFLPDSPVIAGTNREAAECLSSALPGSDVQALERFLAKAAETAPLRQAVPLVPLLTHLNAAGLRLGVMTNDAESVAWAHLRAAEVQDLFEFVAGFDSGHGAKPAAQPLLAFALSVEIAPEKIVMVGDSTHDLEAGRAAGMRTVGVLTGPADAAALAPWADVVLPDIGHLPDWLGLQVNKP